MQSSRILDDACHRIAFAIEGLGFEPNVHQALDPSGGWFDHEVLSSDGRVSDFATHEQGAADGKYGIHLDRDDRLTFFGPPERIVVGHFVDCRTDSATRDLRVSLRYAASGFRRLVVPRGVAHTFDDLRGIVTRNEPVGSSDPGRPADPSIRVGVLSLPPTRGGDWFCHERIQKRYTFLADGPAVAIALFDARRGSPTEGATEMVGLRCDPRIHVRIPNGVAYRFGTDVRLLVRCDHEVSESSDDLPVFGADRIRLGPRELGGFRLDLGRISSSTGAPPR